MLPSGGRLPWQPSLMRGTTPVSSTHVRPVMRVSPAWSQMAARASLSGVDPGNLKSDVVLSAVTEGLAERLGAKGQAAHPAGFRLKTHRAEHSTRVWRGGASGISRGRAARDVGVSASMRRRPESANRLIRFFGYFQTECIFERHYDFDHV
jgi:hypothetical protein